MIYRISTRPIKKRLKTTRFGCSIIYLNQIASTNLLMKGMTHLPEGAVAIAREQTQGRGRLGREWVSHKGGIYMSILLKPSLSPEASSVVTLVAAMAVRRALAIGKIKWPNDIVIDKEKVCGILTEVGEDNSLICGIGVNVSGAVTVENATTLASHEAKPSRTKLIADILNEFEGLYDIFLADGFGPLMGEYNKYLINADKTVRLVRNGAEIIAVAKAVDKDGALVCETEGERFSVTSGEVSVRGIYGYV